VTCYPGKDRGRENSAEYTVLGASGFIGSRLVRMLRASAENCFAPARDDSDIFKRDLGRVFYCIGFTSDYAQRPFDAVEAHVSYLAKLLEKAKFERLVYLSSTRLYDGLPETFYCEDVDLIFNPINKRHVYDLSKALGENLCMTVAKGCVSVARLSNVYDDAPGSPGFLSELMQRIRTQGEFTLDSSSGIMRDYVLIDDVLVALKSILDSGRSEIYNVASGENVSNQEIIDFLNTRGCKIVLCRHSPKAYSGICDVSKLRSLGIEPVLVRDYLRTFLENLEDGNAAC